MNQLEMSPVAQPNAPSLRELCRRIKAGYVGEKTMYDPAMTSLAEELTSRTAEIVDLLDVICGLDGYSHFDVLGVECDDVYMELKGRAQQLATANQP